jgi:hypothetical protein
MIARRRIEWKRNPSMKRSPRSPCWYEEYLFMCCAYMSERRGGLVGNRFSSSFTSSVMMMMMFCV